MPIFADFWFWLGATNCRAGYPANIFVEQAIHFAIRFRDFSALVWPIEACRTPKFAQLNLETFLFNDPMPKNAEKRRFLTIFDFDSVQQIVEQAIHIAICFCDFSTLVWPIEACRTPKFAQLNLSTFFWNDPMPKNAEKRRFFDDFRFC